MDFTYKTNHFKMPLMIITRQIALHIIFYITFAIIAKEIILNYT